MNTQLNSYEEDFLILSNDRKITSISDIIINCRHDILSPLNPINGFSSMLMNFPSAEKNDYPEMINNAGEKLNHILKFLIDHNQFAEDITKIEKTDQSFASNFDEICHLISSCLLKKKSSFIVDDKDNKITDFVNNNEKNENPLPKQVKDNILLACEYLWLIISAVSKKEYKKHIFFSFEEKEIYVLSPLIENSNHFFANIRKEAIKANDLIENIDNSAIKGAVDKNINDYMMDLCINIFNFYNIETSIKFDKIINNNRYIDFVIFRFKIN